MKLLSCFLLFVALASCHKTNTATLNIGQFPNKIGDQWVYLVQDSLAHVNDTLTVTVLSAGNLNGVASLLWQYSYSNGTVDTLQAITSNDTINYYTNPPFPTLSFALLFPIASGSNWKDNSGGSYAVSSLGNYTYQGQNFTNLLTEAHTVQSFDYSLIDDIYVQPNVGVAYRRTIEFSLGPAVYQVWTLIGYHLN